MVDGYAVVVLDDRKQPFIFVARIEKLLAAWKEEMKKEQGCGAQVADLSACITELEELISP
jgi:hypothetical protein